MKKNDCANIFSSDQIIGSKSFYLHGARLGTQIDVRGSLPETTS